MTRESQSRRVGVTGSNGFIGRHLVEQLKRTEGIEVLPLSRAAWLSAASLEEFVVSCDAIVHLAAIIRDDSGEIERGNAELAEKLVAACRSTGSSPHIVYSSTLQRDADNPYGRGKRNAEKILSGWASEIGVGQTTLVIPNVYGAGCRPHYNSVVATFCHQLTHGEQPRVVEDREVEFIWVQSLAESLACAATNPPPQGPETAVVEAEARLRVRELLEILDSFRRDYFERDVVPDLAMPLHANLYATFLSHLEPEDHRHRPPLRTDDRGALCEVIKTAAGGQVFFSTTKPGVVRGNHYHTRKIEWFCVVRGRASIRMRRVGSERVQEYLVSGDSPEFISIPVMHTHSIENIGDSELLTMFWCNEVFDPADADTHYDKVA